jgi:hypothetical protein
VIEDFNFGRCTIEFPHALAENQLGTMSLVRKRKQVVSIDSYHTFISFISDLHNYYPILGFALPGTRMELLVGRKSLLEQEKIQPKREKFF